MPYRIRPAKPFTDEVKAVASAQLGSARSVLCDQPKGIHEAIHEARKKFKRVRGLYRLIAAENKSFRKTENARLRDAATSLSAVRDATALVETLNYLREFSETEEENQSLEHARNVLLERRDAVAEAQTDLDDKVKAVIGACEDAIEALTALSFSDHPKKSAKLLAKGWTLMLERGHEALVACHEDTHAEAFHDLRKAAQAYWMSLSLLRDIWPSAIGAKRTETKRLVDLLGHEHDISLLVELLNLDPQIVGEGGEELSHLLGVIIRRQQALRREALSLADKVFADPPDAEASIVAKLWKHAAKS